MTRNEMNVAVCAILTTLNSADFEGCPESILYLALGSDMEKWNAVRDVMLAGKLIEVTGHWVCLTSTGCQLATKINEIMATSK